MNKYKLKKVYPLAVRETLISIGFDKSYIDKAIDKFSFNTIKISSLRSAAANILKQTALSKGADLGVSVGTVNCSFEYTDGILAATDKQLKMIIESLRLQPYGLKNLADDLETYLFQKYHHPNTMIVRNKSFNWGTKTYLMGVLNITPDSFSDGGIYFDVEKALDCAKKMIEKGVDIIDIGPESTRPFSKPVDTDVQINRALPVIKEIRKQFPDVVLSIDTRDHKVASEAINSGVDIINDVSGLTYDKELVRVAAETDSPIIIMHTQGSPDVMQKSPKYNNLIEDICDFLLERVDFALESGVNKEKIILDPGIGFGKTMEHNLEIIQKASVIKSLGFPLLFGVSRKGFIGKFLDKETDSREEGTAAINTYLVSQGVDLLRIHDVEYHKRLIQLADSISRTKF